MSQPIVVQEESSSALLVVLGVLLVCVGVVLTPKAPEATTRPVRTQSATMDTTTQWVTGTTTQPVQTGTQGARTGWVTPQTNGEVGPQQHGNTPTTAPFVHEQAMAHTNVVTEKALEPITNRPLPLPNESTVPQATWKETHAPSQVYAQTTWKETHAPSQIYPPAVSTPSRTVLASQTSVVRDATPRPVTPSSCPAACRSGREVCTMYMSDWGNCGQDVLWGTHEGKPHDFGWGAGSVELNREYMTDCRGCGGAVEAVPGQYCEGSVCVKKPPNCFGAKSIDDCYTCEDAQKAYAQRYWKWEHAPDNELFCSKWP